MFERKDFTSHAGIALTWKIECDDLSDDDLDTLAYNVSRQISFYEVYGIPRGGVRFANALEQYTIPNIGVVDGVKYSTPRLVVDDVYTTGRSMKDVLQPNDIGLVIFARNPIISSDNLILSMFQYNF